MSKKSKSKPNGKITERPRQAKKAVGHDKRVSAIGRKRQETKAPERVPETVRTASNRINKRRPAVDGTPNYSAPQTETSAAIADSPIEIDDALAGGQLRELAELQAEVNKATAAYNVKKDAARVAKETVDSKTNLLLEKLRMFTHPRPLPLFDSKVESRAVTRMAQGEPVGNQLDLSGDAAAPETDDDEQTQPVDNNGNIRLT